ncbi:YpjP family protein [Thalassobacillus hwangdonensis]|uniref:YpjP family protein n=1 Tax=Thalassobacillus hwangdonensis TaxID=546108 RepID=A0ABW3KXM4_9BACI
MKLWMRKIAVVLISILTLGLYVPTNYLDANAAENEEVSISQEEAKGLEVDTSGIPLEHTKEPDHLEQLTDFAKAQAMSKMGPRIIERMDEEFETMILPEMERVIEDIVSDAGDKASYYEITETATPGYGERMFNIYDHNSEEEVARFHVRRDKRPGEGYWFNFHYHLKNDGFEKHHTIGEVYWDKNTPPKWMS